MERKNITLEVKDLDTSKRIAIIAHAAYDNIDYTKDISRKGMFTKSWKENKDVNFYLNHDDEKAPGKILDLYEDDKHAYTKAWLGTHTLGNDTLLMLDEGIIKKASFGYYTTKSNPITIKGQKIRELKEVIHTETSVLTKMPANIKTNIVSVVKSFDGFPELKTLTPQEQGLLKEININDADTIGRLVSIAAGLDPQSDLYTWIVWNISRRADMWGDVRSQLRYNSADVKAIQAHVKTMEKFCNDTKASDECIKTILEDIEETKQLLTQYNTDPTFIKQVSSGWDGWFNKN